MNNQKVSAMAIVELQWNCGWLVDRHWHWEGGKGYRPEEGGDSSPVHDQATSQVQNLLHLTLGCTMWTSSQ